MKSLHYYLITHNHYKSFIRVQSYCGVSFSEQEKLRRRLTRAERCYMKKKEIYSRMMEAGFIVEELMNEIVAENKELIRRVKEYET